MKFNDSFGSTTHRVGKFFFALILLAVAIAAGFGGTALIVYGHLDGGRAPATRSQANASVAKPSQSRVAGAAKDSDGPRPVAAFPSDQPSYTYADNNGGQPSTPAKRVHPTANVPAPLEDSAPVADVPKPAAGLNDPESHYIVDERTGRVVGIDGSAGARREEDDERQRLESAPRAVVVQTPMTEVRVASAVVEDGQPVYRDGQSIPPTTGADLLYPPVRRALPVTPDATSAESSRFNVAEYLAGGQARPVLRAQPVGVEGMRVAKAVRVYHLSDGSRAVTAD